MPEAVAGEGMTETGTAGEERKHLDPMYRKVFELSIRHAFAFRDNHGQLSDDATIKARHALCPLDVTPDNIRNFAQGSFGLISMDLRIAIAAGMPTEVKETMISVCEKWGVPLAFAARNELVSFKKICLTLFHEATAVERQLRQLVAFFRDPREADAEYYARGDDRAELCNALSECKGALAAVADARDMAKRICCLPRFPPDDKKKDGDSSACGDVQHLPQFPCNLKSWKLLLRGEKFVAMAKVNKGDMQLQPHPQVNSGPALAQESADASSNCSSSTTNRNYSSYSHSNPRPRDTSSFNHILSELSLCIPLQYMPFVKSVLICRGAAKALLMVDVLDEVGGVLLMFEDKQREQKNGVGASSTSPILTRLSLLDHALSCMETVTAVVKDLELELTTKTEHANGIDSATTTTPATTPATTPTTTTSPFSLRLGRASLSTHHRIQV